MTPAHPTPRQLAAFTLGRLDNDASTDITQHLDVCEPCRSTIENLAAPTDTLALAVARPAPADGYTAEPELQQALAVIQQLGEPSGRSGNLEETRSQVTSLGVVRDYELLALLGEGGMGAVYKARHRKLKRIVALKVLPSARTQDASAVARFQREMEAVGRLDHPHIVRAMDAGEDQGKNYLVMEYVRGVDLSHAVRRHGPLAIADACELIRQAAVGLQEAHDNGMVHRDIKPSNLMLALRKKGPPVVKILDMGLALLGHAPGAQELTSTGQLMGTLDYMAPEQGGDSKGVDIRADIYALGATLFKLLTAEAVFHGERYQSPVQKMMALATESAPPIQSRRPEIPDALAVVVDRMLSKDPAARFATPEEVVAALAPFCPGADLAGLLASVGPEDLLADQQSFVGTSPDISASEADTQSSVLPKPRPMPAGVPPRRRRWLVAAALGGFGVLLAGAIVIKVRRGDQETVVHVPDGARATVDGEGNVTIDLADRKKTLAEGGPKSAPDGAQVKPRDPNAGKISKGVWIDLLETDPPTIDGEKLTLITSGVIELNRGVAEFRHATGRNLVLRVKVRKLGGQNVSLGYYGAAKRNNLGAFSNNLHDFGIWRTLNGRGSGRGGRKLRDAATTDGGFIDMAFSVVGNRYRAYVNGRKFVDLTDIDLGECIPYISAYNGVGRFKDVQLLLPTDAQIAMLQAGTFPLIPVKKVSPKDGWVKLLPNLDLETSAESGDWWFTRDETLTVIPPQVTGQAVVTARLALPCIPRGSYELRTRFRRLDADRPAFGFHLPVFGSCTWLLYGKKTPLTFADAVDPQTQGLPETLSLDHLQSKELRIRVDRQGKLARVAVLVENVPQLIWKGDPAELAPPDFVTLKSGGLGIGAAGRYTIETLELRMLDGEAEVGRRPFETNRSPLKSPPDYDAVAQGDWIEVPLEEAAKQAPGSKIVDGVLRVDGKSTAVLLDRYPGSNVVMRADMRLLHGERVQLFLGAQRGEDRTIDAATTAWINADGTLERPGSKPVALRIQPHEWFQLAMAAGGDQIGIYVDGNRILEQPSAAVRSGAPGFGASGAAEFRKIEFMQIEEALPAGVFAGGWKLKGVLQRHTADVTNLAFSPTELGRLATISADGTVRLWETDSGKSTEVIKTAADRPFAGLAWSPDGKVLAIAADGETPAIKLWDVATRQFEEKPLGPGYFAVAFAPDGQTAATSLNETLHMIDVASRKVLWTATTGNIGECGARCIVFSPDGKRVLTGGASHVDIWDAKTGKPLHPWEVTKPGMPVNRIAYSPDGATLAVASDVDELYLMDARSGKISKRLRAARFTQGVAYSPVDDILAYGGEDGIVRVAGNSRSTLRGHLKQIRKVAFAPDGKLLASCSADGTIRLWEAPAPALLAPKDGWLDLLPLVERNVDTNGPWRRYGSGWLRQRIGEWAVLTFPVQPAGESSFELEARFRCWQSKWCSIIFPTANGTSYIRLMAPDGPGLHAAKGADGSILLQRPRFGITPSQDHVLLLHVEQSGQHVAVKAVVDGRQWIDWQGSAGQFESRRRDELRITSNDGSLWFQSARLRMLDGTARLRNAPPADSKRPAD